MSLTIAIPTINVPIRIVHSPDMPAPSKISERPFTWAETKEIVAANDLECFARSSAATEKYLQFKKDLRLHKSTVFKHLVVNTLQWATAQDVEGLEDKEITVVESGKPLFAEKSDLKIVRNDFPYYFEDDVVHLCVWTKKRIVSDPNSIIGDMSAETKQLIEQYVCKTFVDSLGLPRENLLWFRNWEALQSVKEISHVHILVKGLSQEKLESVLGGPGVPLEDRE